MKILYVILFLAGVSSATACHALGPPPFVAARLQSPTPEVRKQLSEVTAKMLGLSTVVLAEHTLTHESQFVLTRTVRYDATGQLMQGRVIEPVHTFKLVLRDDGCWLIYQNRDLQSKLSLARCVPE